MKRRALKKICKDITAELSQRSASEWELTDFPIAYEQEFGGSSVGVELVLLEDKTDYLHIAVCVDDGGFVNAMMPVSSSFIVRKLESKRDGVTK